MTKKFEKSVEDDIVAVSANGDSRSIILSEPMRKRLGIKMERGDAFHVSVEVDGGVRRIVLTPMENKWMVKKE